jgi:rubredoxin
MAKFQCTVCEWIYDEAEEDVPFEELPEDYECPVCGAGKDFFEEI